MKTIKKSVIIALLCIIAVALLSAAYILNSGGTEKPALFPNNSCITQLTFINGSFVMENNVGFINTTDRVDYFTMQVSPGRADLQVKSHNNTVLTLHDINAYCNYTVSRDGVLTLDWAKEGTDLIINVTGGTHDYMVSAQYITPTTRKT